MVSESRLPPRFRGIASSAPYKAQAKEVKRLQRVLGNALEEKWRRYVCFGCMILFPREEVALKGEFDISAMKSSKNWRHLNGLKETYATWQLRVLEPKKSINAKCNLCTLLFISVPKARQEKDSGKADSRKRPN